MFGACSALGVMLVSKYHFETRIVLKIELDLKKLTLITTFKDRLKESRYNRNETVSIIIVIVRFA